MSIVSTEFMRKSWPTVKEYGKNGAIAVALVAAAMGFAKLGAFCVLEGGRAARDGASWALNEVNCTMKWPTCRRD